VLVHLPGGDGFRPVWIVHAGLDPRWEELEAIASRMDTAPHDDDWLESADVGFATSVRCCTADGRRCGHAAGPEGCPEPFRPWDTFYRGPALVIHGHWAARGFYRATYTMGLDSGCVYGGALTAWCQEEDRIVQVPAGTGRHTIDLGRRAGS
jgi:bis(5'-nucleosyl)-tetraphosphatase (symmetrical)